MLGFVGKSGNERFLGYLIFLFRIDSYYKFASRIFNIINYRVFAKKPHSPEKLIFEISFILKTKTFSRFVKITSRFDTNKSTPLPEEFIQEMPKNYFQRLKEQLLERKSLNFVLLTVTLIFYILPQDFGFFKPLFVLFVVTFLLQQIFLLNKSYGFYALRTLVLILAGFELVCGLLNKPNQEPQKIALNDIYTLHDKNYVSRRFAPNCNARVIKAFSETDIAYTTNYCSDTFSRRISCKTGQDSTSHSRHAIFTGCSFTMGEGLPYEETFPYFFKQQAKRFHTYNYGFSGWSAAEMCLCFDSAYLNTLNNASIKEDSGFCLYTYLDDHLDRVYGGSRHLRLGKINPKIMVENGVLKIQPHSRLKVLLSALLNGSESARYFKVRDSYPKTTVFYQQFANLINYSAQKYRAIKPGGTFYVSLYPNSYTEDTTWIQYLDKQIVVLRVATPENYGNNKTKYSVHRWDRHPNALMNKHYAKELIKIMKL